MCRACAKRVRVTSLIKIHADGQEIPVEVCRNPRARRLQFRLDARQGHVRLTLPPGISQARGLDFVAAKAAWIAPRRAKILAGQVAVVEGEHVPVDGILRPLVFTAKPLLRDQSIGVRADRAQSDLTSLIKTHARAQLTPLAHEKASVLQCPIRRLSFRDTRSRWGSCTSDGAISLNWRIVCADPLLQDYLVSHEVAHLREPHHQPAFWELCARLMAQPQALHEARNRLRAVGPKLMALPFA